MNNYRALTIARMIRKGRKMTEEEAATLIQLYAKNVCGAQRHKCWEEYQKWRAGKGAEFVSEAILEAKEPELK